jgi:hypothetical protein
MKFIIFLLVVFSLLYLPFSAECQQAHKVKHGTDVAAASGTEKAPAYLPMPGPGKKVPIIGTDYYLIYGFDKTPKLGTVILKVEIFNKDGKKDTSMEVKADAGMPSMKGAHDMGEQPMKLSNKGDYLIPINIVMPGDWEVRLTLSKDGKVILRGSYPFNV